MPQWASRANESAQSQQSQQQTPSGSGRWASRQSTPAPDSDSDAYVPVQDESTADPDQSNSSGWGKAALAAGATALAGAGLKKYGLSGLVKKIPGWINEARFGSMLSGLAVPKSAAGNIGAAAVAAAEGRSLNPLKAFFNPQTVRDYMSALKSGETIGPVAGAKDLGVEGIQRGSSLLNLPGRLIGAGDVATRKALERGGVAADEAERLLLQSPLPPKTAQALDNPVARWLLPFRRIPHNVFMEGMKTLDPTSANPHRLLTLGSIGAGAAVGAATDDVRTPAITAPFAATYALPYVLGGVAGKYLSSGSQGKAAQVGVGLSPYSDYGVSGAVVKPLRPYTKPAALSAWDYLFGK